MNNPFNFHSNAILAAEAYNLPSNYYDIVKYDKKKDESGVMRGNTHESVEFAGPINSDGTYDESFNYHNSHTRTIMFSYGADQFKFQPAEGYTYQFAKKYYDDGWKQTPYTATNNNPLILDVDDGFRLEIVSASYDSSAVPKEGCTDSTATNYNADATQDDGSCQYAVGQTPQGNSMSAKNTDISNQNEPKTNNTIFQWILGGVVVIGLSWGLFSQQQD